MKMQASLCVVLLVLCVALVSADEAVWRWDNEWMNPENWKSDLIPQSGQVVSFPKSFTKFGREDCVTAGCPGAGGVVSVRPNAANPTVSFKTLQITNGKVQFLKGASMQFRAHKKSATVADSAVWNDHGDHARDFTCAANWLFPSKGNSNPEFKIPCFEDTVTFRANRTFQVVVPKNIYVQGVNWPASSQLSDAHQFSGAGINTNTSACPQLFGSEVGSKYCPALCISTCQSLNPDKKAAAAALVTQYSAELSLLNTALNASEVALTTSLAQVSISGSVTFQLPSDTLASVIQTVLLKVQQDLPRLARFNISFSCVMPSAGTGLACNTYANTTFSKKGELTTKLIAPYTFKDGVLLALFNDIVLGWAVEASANATVASYKAFLNGQFTSVCLQVSSRFMDAVGPTLSTATTRSFLAGSVGLDPANLGDIFVVSSTTPEMVEIIFGVLPVAPITVDSIMATLTSTESPLEFSVGNSVVPLFSPSDFNPPSACQPYVIQVTLANAPLAAALPLSDEEQAMYSTELRNILIARTSYITYIQELIISEPLPEVARRRSADDVLLTMIAVGGSIMDASAICDALSGWTFGDAASVCVTSSSSTMDKFIKQTITASLAEASLTASTLSALSASTSAAMIATGASASTTAIGTYKWADLGIADDGSVLAFFNNEQCQIMMAGITQPTLQSRFSDELSRVLPITSSSIAYGSNIVCQPAIASQTRPDQRAVFVLNLTISTIYSSFAANAAYVAFPVRIEMSLMQAEGVAPLSLKTVRSAAQNALRRVFLTAYKASLEASLLTNQNMFTTTAPAASQASSAGLPLAAVAGGAGFAIILIVVVVVVMRRRKAVTRPAPRQSKELTRTVVAFENPMYSTVKVDDQPLYNDANNPSGGLYDEPAFIGKSDKENPLYEATDEEATNMAASGVEADYGETPAGGANLYGYGGNNAFEPEPTEDTDAGYLDVNE